MKAFRSVALSRFFALPGAIHAQLAATMLNSASLIVKLFMPLLFRGNYTLDFSVIGALMAGYGAGCVIGAYIGGALTSRIDARKITAVCLCMSGALAIYLSRLPILRQLFVIVPVIGVADGAFRPANLRLMMEMVGPDDASWLQGMHRICFNLGVGLAGMAAASLSRIGYPFLFSMAGLANMAGGCLLVRYVCAWRPLATAGRAEAGGGRMSGSPWTDRIFLLFILGQLLALGIFDQMYSAFSLFLSEDYRLDARWIGYLFSLNALLIVLVQIPAMTLIDRLGLLIACRWGTLFLSIAFPLLNLGHGPAYAIATMVCITAAEILLTPAWTLAVMRRSADRDRGRYLGVFSAAWLGHSLYGPASGIWIYGISGGRNLWWVCAMTGVVVWLLHRRVIVPLSSALPGAR